MKNILILFSLCALSAFAKEATQSDARLTLVVDNQDLSAKQLVQTVESMGGYYLVWENQQLVFRLPSDSLDKILKYLPSLGKVMDPRLETFDHSSEILLLSTQIQGDRELLKKYNALMQTMAPESTYVIENAMANLIGQVEWKEGRYRSLIAQCKEAKLDVSFVFTESQLPIPDGTSPFPWITKLHLPIHRGNF